MVANPDIYDLIYMYRHYKKLAKEALSLYTDLADGYLVHDHYMLYVQYYQKAILQQL